MRPLLLMTLADRLRRAIEAGTPAGELRAWDADAARSEETRGPHLLYR